MRPVLQSASAQSGGRGGGVEGRGNCPGFRARCRREPAMRLRVVRGMAVNGRADFPTGADNFAAEDGVRDRLRNRRPDPPWLQRHKRATLVGHTVVRKGCRGETRIPLGSGNGALRLTTRATRTP